MKILHIASHRGNVGDFVNHEGFYHVFGDILRDAEIDRMEMREFYYSRPDRKRFDRDFARFVNSYDLCVLGGGGFFDVKWDCSATGTTLDISDEFLRSVDTPVIINAMGYHEYWEKTSPAACEHFRRFLTRVSEHTNWLITVRNDGSYERMERRYGSDIAKLVLKVPDNGFFCPVSRNHLVSRIADGQKVIGLCVTNDDLSPQYNRMVSAADINTGMARLTDSLAAQGWKIILFQHTPQDVQTCAELFRNISDRTKRNHIMVAPYDASSGGMTARLAHYYSLCNYVIGMRFHSLVTAIHLNIPAVALAGHEQIEALFHELGLDRFCVRADHPAFTESLLKTLDILCSDPASVRKQYADIYTRLEKQRDTYRYTVTQFLLRNHVLDNTRQPKPVKGEIAMKFCTRCIMPNTRPGITFDKNGVCIACQNQERKKSVDWNARRKELEELCERYRRKNNDDGFSKNMSGGV